MKLVLDQPWMLPFDPANDVRVLIACEDSTAAEQACALLDCVGRDCEPAGRLIYRWWNFEVLAISSLRELASYEAAAADLIIIAAHEARKLPPGIANWITRWLDLRKGRRGALVALLDSNLATQDAPRAVCMKLKASAARGHLDFFAVTDDAGEAREIDAWFSKTTRHFIQTSIAKTLHPEGWQSGRNPHLTKSSSRTVYASYN